MSLSKVPHAPTFEQLTPQSGQSWSGYWTTVTALAMFMFVLYISANGLLQQWLALFTFSTPSSVQPGGTGGSSSGASGIAWALMSGQPMSQNAAASALNSAGSAIGFGQLGNVSGIINSLIK